MPRKEQPVKGDILIFVVGTSGAGKSSFINTILRVEKMRVGTDLDSCTRELAFGYIEDLERYPYLKDRRIVLIDTPGFDGTYIDDFDTLEKIVSWLKGSHKKGTTTGGVIYLHDISHDRLNNTARRNLKFFQNVCGDEALKNVVLVTTKWGRKNENAEKRQTQLETTYWKDLIEKGAQVRRFNQSYESALAIIDTILERRGTILQVQAEVILEGKSTSQTLAGKFTATQKSKQIPESKRILRRFTGFFGNMRSWFF